jgi:hypothetical protein
MRSLPLVIALLMFAPLALAQQAQRTDRPTYDPSTVEEIRGTVRSVEMQPSQNGPGYGVHLTLAVGDETVPVHLGPSWFIDNQDQHLAQGDEVEIVGSRVTRGGAAFVIAREVRRGDDVLVLRDTAGYPVWRGWRRSGRGRGTPR